MVVKMKIADVEKHISQTGSDFAILACSLLAGDMFVIITPQREAVLIDCGYHRDASLFNALAQISGAIKHVIITHQHVDHFGSLPALSKEGRITPNVVLHCGLYLPENYVPNYELSSCSAYVNDEEELWLQYHNVVGINQGNRGRWTSCSAGKTTIKNLLPSAPIGLEEAIDSDPDNVNLNYTATPVAVEFNGHTLAMIASDITASVYDSLRPNLRGCPAFFAPASHGRPESNPKSFIEEIDPSHIFISDHFPDSDFRDYYHSCSLTRCDIKSANIDGHHLYMFKDGSIIGADKVVFSS